MMFIKSLSRAATSNKKSTKINVSHDKTFNKLWDYHVSLATKHRLSCITGNETQIIMYHWQRNRDYHVSLATKQRLSCITGNETQIIILCFIASDTWKSLFHCQWYMIISVSLIVIHDNLCFAASDRDYHVSLATKQRSSCITGNETEIIMYHWQRNRDYHVSLAAKHRLSCITGNETRCQWYMIISISLPVIHDNLYFVASDTW
jgi:REP element-mobilizing transposase RayT